MRKMKKKKVMLSQMRRMFERLGDHDVRSILSARIS
jgi:hypothetical protein